MSLLGAGRTIVAMSFLRRLFRGDGPGTPASETVDAGDAQRQTDAETGADSEADAEIDADADTAERRRELDLLREEQARLDDLAQRQLRYARYAWQPPAEGGERRAEDTADGAEVREPTDR
jgi:hypothetical protein